MVVRSGVREELGVRAGDTQGCCQSKAVLNRLKMFWKYLVMKLKLW